MAFSEIWFQNPLPSCAHANEERKTPLAAPLRVTIPQSIGLQSQQYIGFPALPRSPRHNLRHNLPQCVPRLIAPPHYMRALWLHVRPASPQVRSVCALPQPPRRSPSCEASACRVVLLSAWSPPERVACRPSCSKIAGIIRSDRTASRRTAAQGSNVRIIARRTRATKSATSSPSSRTIIQYHIVKHVTRCHTLTDHDRLAQGERIEANKKPRQACGPSGLSHLMGLRLRQLWPLEA